MATATLTSKGQVTIPREVRIALGVGPGDRLDFVKLEDGAFAIVPASRSICSLKGVLARPERPVTLEEMQAAIEDGAKGR
jgi:AbrB family looped-hinge helix DNA binding protein